jgi:hypothetical protein
MYVHNKRWILLTVYASEPAPSPVSTVMITEIIEETPMIQPMVSHVVHLPEGITTI